jgi:hypothetical protein
MAVYCLSCAEDLAFRDPQDATQPRRTKGRARVAVAEVTPALYQMSKERELDGAPAIIQATLSFD